MATMQQAPAADPSADPEDNQDGGSDEGQEASNGFLVCIWVKPDGTFAVGTEDAGEEMQEGADASGAGADGSMGDTDSGASEMQGFTPAKTAKEALTLALGLIKSGGQDNGQAALGKQMQSAGFDAGYNDD